MTPTIKYEFSFRSAVPRRFSVRYKFLRLAAKLMSGQEEQSALGFLGAVIAGCIRQDYSAAVMSYARNELGLPYGRHDDARFQRSPKRRKVVHYSYPEALILRDLTKKVRMVHVEWTGSMRTNSAADKIIRWWRRHRRMLPTNNAIEPPEAPEGPMTRARRRALRRRGVLYSGGKLVVCPITLDTIPLRHCVRLVGLRTGHVAAYDSRSLAEYFQRGQFTCPLTREALVRPQIRQVQKRSGNFNLIHLYTQRECLRKEREERESAVAALEAVIAGLVTTVANYIDSPQVESRADLFSNPLGELLAQYHSLYLLDVGRCQAALARDYRCFHRMLHAPPATVEGLDALNNAIAALANRYRTNEVLMMA